MTITWSDLATIYFSLIGVVAVLLVLANWRIEARRKREERQQGESQ